MAGRTDYLAAAICNALIDRGACDIDELQAQLEHFYVGKAALSAIRTELIALVNAGSVVQIQEEDGTVTYMDGDA